MNASTLQPFARKIVAAVQRVPLTRHARAIGLASTVAVLGLTIVTPIKGTPVHVTVEISLASLSGTWRTPNGDSGPFVFTPGAPTVGYPRPLPADAGPEL